MGILPGGTGNVIARTLGTPLKPGKAVRALLDADEARIDLGRLSTGQRFAVGMGVGLDAAMIADAPAPLKRRFGFFAYVLSATRAVLKMEKFHVRLTVDGETIEREAAAVLIANFGAVLNELISFGDGIRRDDGFLNACIYSPGNLRDAARILWRCRARISRLIRVSRIMPAGSSGSRQSRLGLDKPAGSCSVIRRSR